MSDLVTGRCRRHAWGRGRKRSTFGKFVYAHLVEVHLLRVWAQSDPRVTEEILSYLRLPGLLHIRVVSIDASAGLVEFDDGNGFIGACAVIIETAGHITIKTFRAENDE